MERYVGESWMSTCPTGYADPTVSTSYIIYERGKGCCSARLLPRSRFRWSPAPKSSAPSSSVLFGGIYSLLRYDLRPVQLVDFDGLHALLS